MKEIRFINLFLLLLSLSFLVTCISPIIPTKCEKCGELRKLPVCKLSDSAGTRCKIHIDTIHPTQFAAGPAEVSATLKLGNAYMQNGVYEDMLMMFAVPIIVGLDTFYLTDKHHHVLAIKENDNVANGDKWVLAVIRQNRQGEDDEQFWSFMISENLVWLFDVKGLGPLDPIFLPSSVSELLSDPYRDIAYQLRVLGDVESVHVNYVEFMWANYLRKNIPFPQNPDLDSLTKEWCEIRPYERLCLPPGVTRSAWVLSKDVLTKAVYLSHHVQAVSLPGFSEVRHTQKL